MAQVHPAKVAALGLAIMVLASPVRGDALLSDIDSADALFARDMPDIPPLRTGTTWSVLYAWCESDAPGFCRANEVPRTHGALIAAVHHITLAVKDVVTRQRQIATPVHRDQVEEWAAGYAWALKLAVRKSGFDDPEEAHHRGR